jgi:hypothetical protein
MFWNQRMLPVFQLLLFVTVTSIFGISSRRQSSLRRILTWCMYLSVTQQERDAVSSFHENKAQVKMKSVSPSHPTSSSHSPSAFTEPNPKYFNSEATKCVRRGKKRDGSRVVLVAFLTQEDADKVMLHFKNFEYNGKI